MLNSIVVSSKYDEVSLGTYGQPQLSHNLSEYTQLTQLTGNTPGENYATAHINDNCFPTVYMLSGKLITENLLGKLPFPCHITLMKHARLLPRTCSSHQNFPLVAYTLHMVMQTFSLASFSLMELPRPSLVSTYSHQSPISHPRAGDRENTSLEMAVPMWITPVLARHQHCPRMSDVSSFSIAIRKHC